MDKFEIFNNTNLGQLTAIFGDNGNIWFLTKDVAKILYEGRACSSFS